MLPRLNSYPALYPSVAGFLKVDESSRLTCPKVATGPKSISRSAALY